MLEHRSGWILRYNRLVCHSKGTFELIICYIEEGQNNKFSHCHVLTCHYSMESSLVELPLWPSRSVIGKECLLFGKVLLLSPGMR